MAHPYRLIVAGGRNFADPAFLDQALNRAMADYAPADVLSELSEASPYGRLQVISGGAAGADTLGEQWAKAAGVPVQRYPAAWDNLDAPGAVIRTNRRGQRYNANAGFDRNRQMAENADAVLVMPGGRGTDHMVRVAQELGLPVWDGRSGDLDNLKLLPGAARAMQEVARPAPAAPLWSSRVGDGYEVSSRGDKRFSALYARLPDGRTIEDAWGQAKGYPDGRSAKGQPARDPGFDYWGTYKGLWQQWADANPDLISELASVSEGKPLVDRFAKTENNQARALAEILADRGASVPQPPSASPPAAPANPPAVEQLSFFDEARRFAGQAWPWMAAAGGSAALALAVAELQSDRPPPSPYPPS